MLRVRCLSAVAVGPVVLLHQSGRARLHTRPLHCARDDGGPRQGERRLRSPRASYALVASAARKRRLIVAKEQKEIKRKLLARAGLAKTNDICCCLSEVRVPRLTSCGADCWCVIDVWKPVECMRIALNTVGHNLKCPTTDRMSGLNLKRARLNNCAVLNASTEESFKPGPFKRLPPLFFSLYDGRCGAD